MGAEMETINISGGNSLPVKICCQKVVRNTLRIVLKRESEILPFYCHLLKKCPQSQFMYLMRHLAIQLCPARISSRRVRQGVAWSSGWVHHIVWPVVDEIPWKQAPMEVETQLMPHINNILDFFFAYPWVSGCHCHPESFATCSFSIHVYSEKNNPFL